MPDVGSGIETDALRTSKNAKKAVCLHRKCRAEQKYRRVKKNGVRANCDNCVSPLPRLHPRKLLESERGLAGRPERGPYRQVHLQVVDRALTFHRVGVIHLQHRARLQHVAVQLSGLRGDVRVGGRQVGKTA